MADQVVDAARQVELSKLPLWMGDKDLYSAEDWVERVRRAKETGTWDDARTMTYVYNAMRGEALQWFRGLPRMGIDRENWDAFKAEFIAAYSSSRTARTLKLNLADLRQGPNEKVRTYNARMLIIIDEMDAMVLLGIAYCLTFCFSFSPVLVLL